MDYRAPILSNTSIYAGIHHTTIAFRIMACEGRTASTHQAQQSCEGKHDKEVSHTSATMPPNIPAQPQPPGNQASTKPTSRELPKAFENRSEERRVGKECRSRWS